MIGAVQLLSGIRSQARTDMEENARVARRHLSHATTGNTAARATTFTALASVLSVLASHPGEAQTAPIAFSPSSGREAAQGSPAYWDFDLARMPLAASLRRYSIITGRQILFEAQLLEGFAAPALTGRLGADEALSRLLGGTGLEAEQIDRRTFVVGRTDPVTDEPAADRHEPEQESEDPQSYEDVIVVTGIAGRRFR